MFPAWSAATSHAARIFISTKRRLYEERVAIMQRKHARFAPKANRVLGSEQGDALFGGFLLNRRWPFVSDAPQNRSTEEIPRASRTGCVRRPYTKSADQDRCAQLRRPMDILSMAGRRGGSRQSSSD